MLVSSPFSKEMPASSIYSSELIITIENYVKNLLKEMLPAIRYFHNINHTIQVVQKSVELASFYKISQTDGQALITSAWFHDTGYIHGGLNHEEQSVKIALQYLSRFNLTRDYLSTVEHLILSTKFPAKPSTLIEKILCDADLQHLGSDDYMVWSMLLRKELEHQNGIHLTDEQWTSENIAFFKSHQYFTDHAETVWGIQKQMNLSLLLEIEKGKSSVKFER